MNHEIHEIHERTEFSDLVEVRAPAEEYDSLIYRDETYLIQGAVFEVYREIGYGFLESVYQECMETEMSERGIPFEAQKELPLYFKKKLLQKTFKPDFVCFGKIILELKAVKEIIEEHRAQLFNYLRASRFRLGLLVNFGHHPKATVERIIL
ncbi:MAG: GxxExxY protein [Acidobacteria bacterium]|nr:GxxExxY protein [Acidobacteriota bacterium]